MQTLFIAVYFCIAGSCAGGWVDQPFVDEITCNAYAEVYAQEMHARAPGSSGQIFCVTEAELDVAKSKADLLELEKLENLPPIRQES